MTLLLANTLPEIKHAASLLNASKNTVILTGAGFSTPSGIPDFRSAGSGLWTRFLPMEVASLTSFRHNPHTFFEWLRPLASHMISALPNQAHLALARLEQAGIVKTIITQNIDGLHHRAGSKNVLEVHGTLNTLSCTGCFKTFSSQKYMLPYIEEGVIPICENCGKILKPDIILFEEQLPVRTWIKAEQASRDCDVMLVAGTSLEVMPSAKLPLNAVEHKASLVIVNQSPTYIDVRSNVLIQGNVAEIIPQLAAEILNG